MGQVKTSICQINIRSLEQMDMEAQMMTWCVNDTLISKDVV